MARVTVEDCLEQVENRFALVILASKRTKELKRGAPLLIRERDNREVVMGLREIAAGKVKARVSPSEDTPENTQLSADPKSD